MKIVGCDWSMTTPAITVFENGGYEFHYYTTTKSHVHYGKFNEQRVFGTLQDSYPNQEARFKWLVDWAMDIIGLADQIFLEDYAFAGKGRVFGIAESMGLLKHYVWLSNIPFQCFAPTAIKKFATGKGNAKKPEMISKFIEETKIDLYDLFGIQETAKNLSPISDIADSYFVCKYGISKNSA